MAHVATVCDCGQGVNHVWKATGRGMVVADTLRWARVDGMVGEKRIEGCLEKKQRKALFVQKHSANHTIDSTQHDGQGLGMF